MSDPQTLVNAIGDRLRAAGPRLTFADCVAAWREVLAAAPEQGEHAYADAVLNGITDGSVLEFGCWRGELAATVLEKRPGIIAWHGFDILPELQPVCDDPRFSYNLLTNWPCTVPTNVDVVIASHILEHLPNEQVRCLFDHLEAHDVYIEIPSAARGVTDRTADSTHICTLSWEAIIALADKSGYYVQSNGARERPLHPWFWAWLRRA